MPTTVHLVLPNPDLPLYQRLAALVTRQFNERAGVVVSCMQGEYRLLLDQQPGIGAEGYCIEDAPGGVRIVGNDARGLLYGIGKFLRACRFDDGVFTPGAWRGVSVPTRAFRTIYFATHFHNFYHAAPINEVTRYIEDLALWGYNGLCVWFDMHHFQGIDDPAAQAMLARLRALLQAAKALDLRVGIVDVGNEGYANSPEELRAEWRTGDNDYTGKLSHYHVELCPNKPGAKELLLRWFDEIYAQFQEIGLDFLTIWPYDQGGCTCTQCKPWGANGFLSMAEAMAATFRARFPQAEIIVSTWLLEHFIAGEWAALHRALGDRATWLTYLMVDTFVFCPFPEYPLTHGVPGGVPMLNFPEISMHAAMPWGGYGASPYPRRLQEVWNSSKHALAGGFPYSEGIFEDLNKAVYVQFYWEDRPADETIREYCGYYFGEEHVVPLSRVIELLEDTLPRDVLRGEDPARITMAHPDGAVEAFALMQQIEPRLTPQARASWRWQLLYLRTLIDAELVTHDQRVTDRCEAAFHALERLYYTPEEAVIYIAPPTREAIRAWRRPELPDEDA